MKSRDYIVEFSKLKAGTNEFSFVIDHNFLQAYEFSPVKDANAAIKLNLFRTENMMELHFTLSGNARVSCDTCNDEFDLPLSESFSLIIKLTDGPNNLDDDEIIYLNKKEIQYDLRQYLYESFLLSLPRKKGCEMAGKSHNPDTLKHMTTADEQNEEPDPRWDSLKNLFNKN